MQTFKLSPVALALLALTAVAQAQSTGSQTLPEVVVRTSPIIEANRVDNFSGYTTQVGESQLKDLSALDLAAGLRMTPGVQISRYNEVGSYSGDQGGNVYIRGLGTSRPGGEIKTYIDGIPVYMGLWNHPLIDLLPLNGMQSVDIQKGPQPMQSGNNFGAINLSTKRAQQDGLQGNVHLAYGSRDTTVAQATLLGRDKAVDFMLAAGYVDSNGARKNADGTLNNAMGRLGLKFNEQWQASVQFLSVTNKVGDPGDARYPASTSAIGPYSFSNGIARNETDSNLLAASVNHQHGSWRGELKVFENRGRNDLRNDSNWGTFKSSFNMNGVRWKERFSLWKGNEVQAGVDYDSTSGQISGPHVGAAVGTPFAFNNAGSANIPSFKVTSPYLGVSQKISLSDQWVLLPAVGVRRYDSNVYANKTGHNAGLSLASERFTLFANYAEGILYPGAETYTLTRAIPMAFTVNNGWDRLSPSENKHTEVGFKWAVLSNLQADVTVFQDRISKRYIWSGFNANATGTWSNNYPGYRINGVEVALKYQINKDWSWFTGLTTLDPSIDNLPYAPNTAVSTGINGQLAGLRIALDAQRQSGMYTLTQDRGTYSPNQVSGFTVANTRIAYPVAALGKQGEVYVAINNLFNRQYEYNAGYTMPGRNVRVGLMASF